ncbi:MAG: glycosyltransferase [Burkholderiales bacterium]
MNILTEQILPFAKNDAPSIIVHSHLRWDFVWQRPQQTHSRLAQDFAILFLEEPVYSDAGEKRLSLSVPQPNIIRAVPCLPAALRDDYDASVLAVRSLLREAFAADKTLATQFKFPIFWFYTPMPAPAMLGQFRECAVVYDCMDELSQFHGAPNGIAARETALLAKADIVFTGGRKLFESKSRFHNNVHFFGCGVDVEHYARARSPAIDIPQDVAHLQGPVAGYIGVIDERVDYDLISRLAESNPSLQIVMVGPVVKVDPDKLPRQQNIHWMGQRDYTQLPSYIKLFDVCLMPFALNEATEYINPTKTLEYLAAGKPVVSTAIGDVIRNFRQFVSIAGTHEEFVERVLSAAAAADPEVIEAGIAHAATMTWDSIVLQMKNLLDETVYARSSARISVAS